MIMPFLPNPLFFLPLFILISGYELADYSNGYEQTIYHRPHQKRQSSHGGSASSSMVKLRHIRRTRTPIVYKERPLTANGEGSPYSSTGAAQHAISLDMDWRGWTPVGGAQQTGESLYNDEPSEEGQQEYQVPPYKQPNYQHTPQAYSRVYFKKYHPHQAQPNYYPNEPTSEQPEYNSYYPPQLSSYQEPVEMGVNAMPTSTPSLNVADLYKNLKFKRRYPKRHSKPSAPSSVFYPQTMYGDQPPRHQSQYPNFDDEVHLFGFNNYIEGK